ncbi:MAG: tRNA lysidine(34) synthetase TilS [Faecousia sp.]
MLNKLLRFSREYGLIQPGDRVTCAVSGGADSMALLWAMYLLRDKWGLEVCAAHFNHHLRGEESNRDEAFVREFCLRYDIPLTVGGGTVTPGKKGLEAAAREARYTFLRTLPGKIATAHTADDNAETVLMHLIRGTGLKGLGAISPVNGPLIRPMLTVTRQEVLGFLEEYQIPHIEDSSNETDDFLRNRVRHHILPLLRQENPGFVPNTSAMALRLRQDEQALSHLARGQKLSVSALRQMEPSLRSRVLEDFLKRSGVKEPESEHIALAEALVFSEKPSAWGCFPGGVTVCRSYDTLRLQTEASALEPVRLPANSETELPRLGLRVICREADALTNTLDTFTVCPEGPLVLRSRRTGDEIRLSGGTKSLKKLLIDRKIPADQRLRIPVLADDAGVLGVYGIGVNQSRAARTLPALQIHLEPIYSGESR